MSDTPKKPRITRKVARRLNGIASALYAAIQEQPGVDEKGELYGHTDFYVDCQTEKDCDEVAHAAEWVIKLLRYLADRFGDGK